MTVVGQWTLNFEWDCVGSYTQVEITFNSNGTFASDPYTGKWVEMEGKILWQVDPAPDTIYGGNIAGSAMIGAMTTFAGMQGCWYAIKAGSTTMLAKERKPEFDAAGNKAKY